MRKIALFFLIIMVFSCSENAIYKDYNTLKGMWNVKGNSSQNSNILRTINFSCSPSKRLSKDENLSCGGYLNAADNSGTSIVYRLTDDDTIKILSITEGMDYNSTSQEIESLKKILMGKWQYTISEENMEWVNSAGESILFNRAL